MGKSHIQEGGTRIPRKEVTEFITDSIGAPGPEAVLEGSLILGSLAASRLTIALGPFSESGDSVALDESGKKTVLVLNMAKTTMALGSLDDNGNFVPIANSIIGDRQVFVSGRYRGNGSRLAIADRKPPEADESEQSGDAATGQTDDIMSE